MTDERLEEMLNMTLTPEISDEDIIVDLNARKEPKVIMKNVKFRKIAIVAACMSLVVGTTAFAGGKVKYFSSHSRNDEYPEFSDIVKAERKAGFESDVVEKFSNGYEFDHGDVAETAGEDENHNTVVTFKQLGTSYKNADGNTIFLNAQNMEDYNDPDAEDPEPDEVRNFDGIDVKYWVYRQLLNVPEDAELTDEEKALDEAGKLWKSYDGGTDIEKYDIAVLEWEKDGIRYALFDHHAVETADSLFSMAEELIAQ